MNLSFSNHEMTGEQLEELVQILKDAKVGLIVEELI